MEYKEQNISDVLSRFPPNAAIQEMVYKTLDHIEHEAMHNGKIMVSISGGSDSDIMMDLFERIGYPDGLVVYVWFDTGLEYDATKRHLKDLEAKYGVEIKRYRPKMTVAQAVKKYGVPFLAKNFSEYIGRLQAHGFDFTLGAFEDLYGTYPKCKAALRFWCNQWNGKSHYNIDTRLGLREFMVVNKPPKISDKCCEYAKKGTSKIAQKEQGATLSVVGVRRAEGGARATAYTSCFSEATKAGIAQFRPLFYLTDQDKQEYKEFCGVTYSDCYEVWGFKRTGCCCCPFGSGFEYELEVVRQYEPKLYSAACKIFGPSYEYTRKYRKFKEAYKREKRRHGQIDLFDNPDTIVESEGE